MRRKMLSRAGIAAAAATAVVGAVIGASSANAAPAPAPPGSSDIVGGLNAGSAAADRATGGAVGQLRGLIDGLDLGSSGGGTGQSGPPAVRQCNASTQSGHDGVTNTIHTLGRGGPLAFTLTYETENVPDRIEVFYQARRIYDTGFVGDNTNEGTGSVRVAVPAGLSGSVLVRVSGGTNTDWEYTLGCPN